MKKSIINRILVCIILLLIYLIIISFIGFIRFGKIIDIKALQFYIKISYIAIIAIFFKLYLFGYTFLSSIVIGFIVGSILSYIDRFTPNMRSAVYTLFIISVGFLLGIIVELIYRIRRHLRKEHKRD